MQKERKKERKRGVDDMITIHPGIVVAENFMYFFILIYYTML